MAHFRAAFASSHCRMMAAIAEMKVFDPHDGLALKLAHTMGIRTGFITAANRPPLRSAHANAK